MTDTTWTCDRCNEINDISDVTIVEHAYDNNEIVCKPCLLNQYEEEKKRANEEILACYADGF